MVYGPREDHLRCQQCVNRYGKAAPWNCVVCEETWANWCHAKISPGQLPEIGFPHIDDFSVSAVANLIDVAFCPMRTSLKGQMLRVSGKNRADDFDLTLFLREFERRLERVHDGRMEFEFPLSYGNLLKLLPASTALIGDFVALSFDYRTTEHDFAQRVDRVHGGRMELLDEQAADAKALKQWLSQRLGVKKETMDRRLYRISVYGKEFLAAFLSAKRNFFAKYGKHVTDEKQLKKKQANFLVAIFDV
ncbi:unnamed protein product, partial [Mesorhabditis spiculigera]